MTQLRKNSPQTPSMHTAARRWLLPFAVLGLLTSGTSTYVHYRLLLDRGYTSFCDINTTLSCTDAYLSRYGSFGGVPVAVLGFVWFVLAAALAWLARPRPGERASAAREGTPAENASGYLFVMSTAGLAVVLYLAYAAFFVLKAVCLLCLGTYVAVIGLFVLSGMAMDFPMMTLPARLAADLRRLVASPAALVLTLVLAAGAATVVAFFPRDSATDPGPGQGQSQGQGQGQGQGQAQSEFERWYFAQPMVDPGISPSGEKVLVVKFNDYQCPACGQSHKDYKGVFAKYEASHPGAVRVVSRDYPLDPECNFNTPNGSHQAACEAAVAVRLAARHGKRDAMEEWLYSNQTALTPQSVRQAAAAIGAVPDYDAQYQKVLQEVRADVAAGGAVNVRSTPSFIINGRLISGALPAPYFDQAIAIELKRAGVQ